VAFSGLEVEHYSRQLFSVYLSAIAHLADGIVLAEDTLQIAVGEENCP